MLIQHYALEVSIEKLQGEVSAEFGYFLNMDGIQSTLNVLEGHFVSNETEYQKYAQIDILKASENRSIQRVEGFAQKLNEKEFHKELKDIISVGLQRYKDKYIQNNNQDVPFVLYVLLFLVPQNKITPFLFSHMAFLQ